MNTHFVLRNNYINKEGLQQIQLIYCANNQQLRLDTGVRIRPKDWNDSKQQILSSVTEIGKTSKELNDILIEKQKKVLTIVSDFKKEHDNGTSVSPDPNGQNGISDHLPPVLADHLIWLIINNLRWSGCFGEGWLIRVFFPDNY